MNITRRIKSGTDSTDEIYIIMYFAIIMNEKIQEKDVIYLRGVQLVPYTYGFLK